MITVLFKRLLEEHNCLYRKDRELRKGKLMEDIDKGKEGCKTIEYMYICREKIV
jgi:hypothetical protein